jgi:hypothetical protein
MLLTDEFLKNAADLRDVVIFLASIIYIIGYVTWASYSYYRKLGTVKALDAQYFVIGIPVAIIIILVVTILSKLSIWIDAWYQYLSRLDLEVTVIAIIVLNALTVITATNAIRTFHKNPRRSSILIMISWFAAVLIPDSGGFLRLTANVVLVALTLVIFGAVIIIYVTRIYELIPHSLGGGRCRTARLDLMKDKISSALLKELASNPADNHPIIRSCDVTVVSVSDSWMLIRIGKIQDVSAPIIELPRTSIASIAWLAS